MRLTNCRIFIVHFFLSKGRIAQQFDGTVGVCNCVYSCFKKKEKKSTYTSIWAITAWRENAFMICASPWILWTSNLKDFFLGFFLVLLFFVILKAKLSISTCVIEIYIRKYTFRRLCNDETCTNSTAESLNYWTALLKKNIKNVRIASIIWSRQLCAVINQRNRASLCSNSTIRYILLWSRANLVCFLGSFQFWRAALFCFGVLRFARALFWEGVSVTITEGLSDEWAIISQKWEGL